MRIKMCIHSVPKLALTKSGTFYNFYNSTQFVTLWMELFSILFLILIEFSLGFKMRCNLFHTSNQNMVKIIKLLERSPMRCNECAVFDGRNCMFISIFNDIIHIFKIQKFCKMLMTRNWILLNAGKTDWKFTVDMSQVNITCGGAKSFYRNYVSTFLSIMSF